MWKSCILSIYLEGHQESRDVEVKIIDKTPMKALPLCSYKKVQC